MFGIFKKKTEKVSTAVVSQGTATMESPYPKEVQEIHREFHSASDRLLAEANTIIEEAKTKDVDKVKRLETLGFKQVQQVAEIKPLMIKAELSEETIGLVSLYKRKYPLNKFITEEQVKAICFKYNLICGGVSKFKGFVPEKNLKQIESFKVSDADILDTSSSVYFVTSKNGSDDWKLLDAKESDMEESYARYLKKAAHYVEYACPHLNGGEGRIVTHYVQPELLEDYVGLKICAPVKDMDLTGMTIQDGYQMKKVIKHVPDPVVLQPVKGGYLILTAWGDEASDPLVVNEVMN